MKCIKVFSYKETVGKSIITRTSDQMAERLVNAKQAKYVSKEQWKTAGRH